MDSDTPLAERQGDTAGTDPKFESAATSGQLGKEAHYRLNEPRVEHVR